MKKVLSTMFVALALVGCSSSKASDIQACVNQFSAGNYQKAIQYGEKAAKEFPKNPRVYFCLGRAYAKVGQLDKAIENLKKASQYQTNPKELMYVYNWLGVEYDNKGDFNKALSYDQKNLQLAKQLKDVDAERYALVNMAVVFREKGDDAKALKYYKKAIGIENSASGLGPLYNNIALIYQLHHNYKKAIEYYKKALIYAKNEHCHSIGVYLLNLGNAYRAMKDYKDAKLYLKQGLEEVKKAGDKLWEATGYKYLGWYYEDKGNKTLARKYLTKALSMFKTLGDNEEASAVVKDLASIKKY